jgi:hypothetical protein
LADSADFKGIASNKPCNGLTGSCFESPNDTIHVTVVANVKERLNNYENKKINNIIDNYFCWFDKL